MERDSQSPKITEKETKDVTAAARNAFGGQTADEWLDDVMGLAQQYRAAINEAQGVQTRTE